MLIHALRGTDPAAPGTPADNGVPYEGFFGTLPPLELSRSVLLIAALSFEFPEFLRVGMGATRMERLSELHWDG